MSAKRMFRGTTRPDSDETPTYPTLDEFEVERRSRRDFLGRLGALGAALLGAGALAACSDRAVGGTPDATPPMPDGPSGPAGAAPMPDSGIDRGIDKGQPVGPDADIIGGVAQQPDAGGPKPDMWNLAGEAPQPDAGLDVGWPTLGKVAQPDAGLDTKPQP